MDMLVSFFFLFLRHIACMYYWLTGMHIAGFWTRGGWMGYRTAFLERLVHGWGFLGVNADLDTWLLGVARWVDGVDGMRYTN